MAFAGVVVVAAHPVAIIMPVAIVAQPLVRGLDAERASGTRAFEMRYVERSVTFARMHIRKHMRVRRRSAPPIEEAPQTWSEVIFFPLSKIVLALMAAMLLIFLCSVWLYAPPYEYHEEYKQPPPLVMEVPKVDQSAPLEAPPGEQRPAGGIVIEK